mmetsp:Transcript_78759/g.198794  ORF Transcript_78759/g.198794 Transcript_78759/m.198794 type:complete len:152 (+) Transcript_78759:64-519(+)
MLGAWQNVISLCCFTGKRHQLGQPQAGAADKNVVTKEEELEGGMKIRKTIQRIDAQVVTLKMEPAADGPAPDPAVSNLRAAETPSGELSPPSGGGGGGGPSVGGGTTSATATAHLGGDDFGIGKPTFRMAAAVATLVAVKHDAVGDSGSTA